MRGWWRALLGSLLAAALVCGTFAADQKTTSPIPLAKGTRWVYAANIKWTPVAGSGLASVQSNHVEWTSEVLDCFQGKFARAAVVHAFPMDILGMDPEKPTGCTVLAETGNRLYSASAKTASKARKLARQFAAEPNRLAGQLLLELPLHADKRWGEVDDSVPREDGWYCWRVEAEKAQRLQVKGLSAADYFSVYTAAFRTGPDHQVIDVVPSVGIVHLEYEHHGTVGWEDVRLVQFKPPNAKPEPASRPKN
jgi:hypothetical protein